MLCSSIFGFWTFWVHLAHVVRFSPKPESQKLTLHNLTLFKKSQVQGLGGKCQLVWVSWQNGSNVDSSFPFNLRSSTSSTLQRGNSYPGGKVQRHCLGSGAEVVNSSSSSFSICTGLGRGPKAQTLQCDWADLGRGSSTIPSLCRCFPVLLPPSALTWQLGAAVLSEEVDAQPSWPHLAIK